MAIDRTSFIEEMLHGLGRIITGPFYLKSWAYNTSIKPIPYDLEKAAATLASAGWVDRDGDGILDKDGVAFKFELLISPGPAQLAPLIQANLKKLSIEVTIRTFEWSVYLQRISSGDFDAAQGGWYLAVDPDPYAIWHSSQIEEGNNDSGFVNHEVDRLLEQGRREFDRAKRQKIYWKIHEIIHDEQPYTFIVTPMETYILSKRIKNYHISPYGLFGFIPGQLSWTLE